MLDPLIALLDYGAGNIRSVEKALRATNTDVQRISHPKGLAHAHGMVLPGVGSFDDCVNALDRQELREGIVDWIQRGRPFLGICVGYQALFDRSEEFNSCALGLKIFEGSVVRFQTTSLEPRLKIPQIGWNQVSLANNDCPLFQGIPTDAYFYFVHSYYPQPTDPRIVAGNTHYGRPFASAIWRDNVFATQFHPEKSQSAGLRLLENFVKFCKKP